MNSSTLIKVPVVSYRKLENPDESVNGKIRIAIVRVQDIPDAFEDWREINPRDPKLTSGVSKKISESLREHPQMFLIKNRGLTVLVERAEFDNVSNYLTLEVSNKEMHGLLDGGHTYEVIKDYLSSLNPDEKDSCPAMIKLEILEGIAERDEAVNIVEARNTSTQVKEQSLQDLQKKFELIKEVLKDEPYSSRIAYKEFELAEDGGKKDIDIREILSFLLCFDVEEFGPKKNHPIKAYSAKASSIRHFTENEERMKKYVKLLPEILKLRDTIHEELPDAYNKESGGKFGRLTGVEKSSRKGQTELVFLNKTTDVNIPNGYIYPILASFRFLVGIDEKDNQCFWKMNPFEVWQSLKGTLAEIVGHQAKEFRNANKLGKDATTWRSCYDAVTIEVLTRQQQMQ